MNNLIITGRLVNDGRATEKATFITLANDDAKRRTAKTDNPAETDFIDIMCAGRNKPFADQYLKKGTAVIVQGHLHSYRNNEGHTVQIVIADHVEFQVGNRREEGGAAPAQTAPAQAAPAPAPAPMPAADGFLNIPDGLDEELPFV